MKSITSSPIEGKAMQKLGKDLSALKQHHIASIHKSKHHIGLHELVEEFRRDMQEHVRRIN